MNRAITENHEENHCNETNIPIENNHSSDKNYNYFVCALSLFFGIGSWLGVNSTCLQVPLMIKTAPEEWKLPSFMEIIMQISNIGPLSYTIFQKFSPKKLRDSHLIYFLLIIGVIVSILIGFFYQKTTNIGGKNYSITLFIFYFCFALIGCSSSVLFMPYMGRFKEIYLLMYFVGEGMNGFLTSLIALIQGVGGNTECIPIKNSTNGTHFMPYTPPPRFESQQFFIYVFIMMTMSLISFCLLDKLKIVKKEYVSVKIDNGNIYDYNNSDNENKRNNLEKKNIKMLTPRNISISPFDYKILLCLMGFIGFFEIGILASVQSYSCLPYGNIAYHLTVTLTLIVNPIASYSAIFLPKISIKMIMILTLYNTFIGFYILTTALMSPNPPLLDSTIGKIIIIFCWTSLMGLFTFIKVNVSTIMRSQGGRSLVWTGAASQLGTCIGAVTMFLLVNLTSLFVSKEPCT